ncbi:MAG: CBS domain-containing protein [Candidatus Hydrogenedentota bacterium]|nr:MAG: CBS domain-containing protein [Candidatus Hydrogenedentota bacterium]
MREIRTYGSEGGGTGRTGPSYPYHAMPSSRSIPAGRMPALPGMALLADLLASGMPALPTKPSQNLLLRVSYVLEGEGMALDLAIILIGGLFFGHIAGRLHIQKVTAYLLWGILLGPGSALLLPQPILSPSDLSAVRIVSDLALGLIMFGLGGELTSRRLRKISGSMIRLCLLQAAVVFLIVLTVTFALGAPGSAALLLASIAVATAPAATLLVIKEYRASGHTTDVILSLTALNTILSIFLFRVSAAVVLWFASGTLDGAVLARDFSFAAWYLLGSVALGTAVGLLMSVLEQRRREGGDEVFLVYFGSVLLGLGGARFLGVSPLLTMMFCGMVVLNAFYEGEEVFSRLKDVGKPLYVVFFVAAGAALHFGELAHIGLLGIGYILARATGKIAGTALGAFLIRENEDVRYWVGPALLCHGAVSLGLLYELQNESPLLASPIATIILSAVAVFELAGPLLERFSLIHVGEIELESLVHHKELGVYRMHLLETVHYLLGSFGAESRKAVDTLRVRDVMNKRFSVLAPSSSLKEVIHIFQTSRRNVQPVLDADGLLQGVIVYDDISHLAYYPSMNQLLVAGDLMRTRWLTTTPETPLTEALVLFQKHDEKFLIVTEPEAPRKLLGILEEIDAVTADRRSGRKEG